MAGNHWGLEATRAIIDEYVLHSRGPNCSIILGTAFSILLAILSYGSGVIRLYMQMEWLLRNINWLWERQCYMQEKDVLTKC